MCGFGTAARVTRWPEGRARRSFGIGPPVESERLADRTAQVVERCARRDRGKAVSAVSTTFPATVTDGSLTCTTARTR